MDIDCSENNNTLGLREWLATPAGDKDNAIGRSDVLAAIVDSFEIAIILTDRDAKIFAANRAARDILRSGSGLVQRAGVLTSKSAREQQALKCAIASAAKYRKDSIEFKGGYRSILIPRSEKLSLTVSIYSTYALGIRPEPITALHLPTVAISVTDPELLSADSVTQACRLYGLSPRELRIAEQILNGFTISGIAEKTGIKEATVRAYLKNIFLKTHVARQSMLVRLLLTSRVPITVQQ